ncbi:MAG: tryptophan synthase subunit alpha, partial [Cyanobacteria bacterium KgW148]|nr:tryptophan synthase subunit alpha [Cyanobacteria bacterium KgW148]
AISEKFKMLRNRGEASLIPFITAGDPDLETTIAALEALDRAGADLIELGIPYADPLADGPVIQAAATRALQKGTNLGAILAVLEQVKGKISAPLIIFSYFNPILQQGIPSFLQKIYDRGARGLVVPDLPLEEAENLLQPARAIGIEVTLLIAPTTPRERMATIAAQSEGFIYLVSTTGVTGMRAQVGKGVQRQLEELRTVTDKPIGVGFGISQPEHAKQVISWNADAAIVGSAMVKRLAEDGVQSMAELCLSLKQAIRLEETIG